MAESPQFLTIKCGYERVSICMRRKRLLKRRISLVLSRSLGRGAGGGLGPVLDDK